MEPKCRKCGTPTPRPAAAPNWADPRLIMQQTAVRISSFDLSGLIDPQIVAPADPRRVAIGFSAGQNGQPFCGVTADPVNSGWAASSGSGLRPLFFTLFEHGPLVNLQWWSSPVGNVVFVYEIYRLS